MESVILPQLYSTIKLAARRFTAVWFLVFSFSFALENGLRNATATTTITTINIAHSPLNWGIFYFKEKEIPEEQKMGIKISLHEWFLLYGKQGLDRRMAG